MAARPGYAPTKEELLLRLRRIEGQVRGLERMVEEERYCIDVLTQVGAVRRALDRVALGLVADHTRQCVVGAEGKARDERVEELVQAIDRLHALR